MAGETSNPQGEPETPAVETPAVETPAVETPAVAPPKPGTNRRATSDVRSLWVVALALPLLVVTVLGASALPRDYRDIMLDRGWTVHTILVLTCLAIAMLFLKARALRAQRRAFQLDVLPPDDSRITPDNVARVIDHVEVQRTQVASRNDPPSFLIERVLRILQHFAARGDVAETATVNNTEGEADAFAVASSFSVVKVLVWAIPIMGFIGTVTGIGDAVNGFSRSLEGAGQLDAIKTSLGDVTKGLAVAFDSTLVALIASILVMVPTSWLQKAEDQLVGDVDDYCVTKLQRRLASPSAAQEDAPKAPAAAGAEDVRRMIAETVAPVFGEMLGAHTRLLARLAEEREELSGSQIAMHSHLASFTAAMEKMAPTLERAAGQLERVTKSSERAAGEMLAANAQLAARITEDRGALAAQQAAMREQLAAVLVSTERIGAGVEHVTSGIERAGSGIERATAAMQRVTVMERTAGAMLPVMERAARQLESSTAVAERASSTAGHAQEQLCRELGASRQLLQLLAAGMGATADARGPASRTANGANGSNGNGSNGAHAE